VKCLFYENAIAKAAKISVPSFSENKVKRACFNHAAREML
jgi:hypothetical protein